MMEKITKQPLFGVGQLVATPGALAALEKTGRSPAEILTRHVAGDWEALRDDGRRSESHTTPGQCSFQTDHVLA